MMKARLLSLKFYLVFLPLCPGLTAALIAVQPEQSMLPPGGRVMDVVQLESHRPNTPADLMHKLYGNLFEYLLAAPEPPRVLVQGSLTNFESDSGDYPLLLYGGSYLHISSRADYTVARLYIAGLPDTDSQFPDFWPLLQSRFADTPFLQDAAQPRLKFIKDAKLDTVLLPDFMQDLIRLYLPSWRSWQVLLVIYWISILCCILLAIFFPGSNSKPVLHALALHLVGLLLYTVVRRLMDWPHRAEDYLFILFIIWSLPFWRRLFLKMSAYGIYRYGRWQLIMLLLPILLLALLRTGHAAVATGVIYLAVFFVHDFFYPNKARVQLSSGRLARRMQLFIQSAVLIILCSLHAMQTPGPAEMSAYPLMNDARTPPSNTEAVDRFTMPLLDHAAWQKSQAGDSAAGLSRDARRAELRYDSDQLLKRFAAQDVMPADVPMIHIVYNRASVAEHTRIDEDYNKTKVLHRDSAFVRHWLVLFLFGFWAILAGFWRSLAPFLRRLLR